MGLKIDGTTISKSVDSSQELSFNSKPVEIDLLRLPNKTSGIFTYPTFSPDFVYTTLEFEDNLISDGWDVSNNYTASYDDGKVSFVLNRVTSGSYQTHTLSLRDFRIDFSKFNSAVTINVPIKEATDSADDSISYIQVYVGYTDKKTMFICIRQFISTGHMEQYYATDAWSGTIKWLDIKHSIEQSTVINGDLTVNKKADFRESVTFQNSVTFQDSVSFSKAPTFNSKKVGSVTFLYDNWHDYGKNSYCSGSVGKLLSPDALYVFKGVSGTIYPLRSDIGHQSRIFDATGISLYSSMPKIPTSEIHLQFLMEMSVNYSGDSSYVTFYVTSVDTNIDCKVSASTNSFKKCTSDLTFDIYEILKFN
jgi:hypothetical protein